MNQQKNVINTVTTVSQRRGDCLCLLMPSMSALIAAANSVKRMKVNMFGQVRLCRNVLVNTTSTTRPNSISQPTTCYHSTVNLTTAYLLYKTHSICDNLSPSPWFCARNQLDFKTMYQIIIIGLPMTTALLYLHIFHSQRAITKFSAFVLCQLHECFTKFSPRLDMSYLDVEVFQQIHRLIFGTGF